MFKPPKRVGSDKSSLSLSEHRCPPVIAGMNSCLMVCSRG